MSMERSYEKHVWEVKYRITVTEANGRDTVDETRPKYIYASAQWIDKLVRERLVKCKTYQEFIKAVDDGYFPGCYVGESLFGKKEYVGLVDRINGDIRFKEKKFKSATSEFVALRYVSTIKDYANSLSADEFIEYCLDKGLSVREEWLDD